MSSASPGKIDYIQALRGIAAVSVVMCHAGQFGAVYSQRPSIFAEPSVHLAYGVDLFFVISGFIIYYTTTRADLSAREFLQRRLQRIVPIYWLLTLVFFACLLLLPGLKSTASNDWIKLAASLSFVSFTEWQYPVIYPGWTLEYEMLFYALAFIGLWAVRRAPWAFVSVALCAATLARFALGASPHRAWSFLTESVVLAFMMGIVVGQIVLKGRPGRIEVVALLVGLVAAAWQTPISRAFTAGLPSAAIVYLAVTYGRNWPPVPSLLSKLGDASYSTYLMHVFIMSIVGKLFRVAMPGINAELLVVIMVIVPVVAGLFMYRWVELPIANFFARRQALRSARMPDGLARPAVIARP